MLYVLWVYHGIFILHFLTTIKYPMQTYTLKNGNICMKLFEENVPHSSKGETYASPWWPMVTFSKNQVGKNIGFSVGCLTPSTTFTRAWTKRYLSFSFSERGKNFSRRFVENVFGKLLLLDTSWILLERNHQAAW